MAANDGGAGRPPNNLPEGFGRYRLLRELGRGGMGVVYQARHTVMNREVVIKVISKALLDQPAALERFRREVQAAAQLAHPNIVTAHDAEQAGDTHFLVMEFVPGQSLAEVLQKKGPLPVVHACHYARQVALGLQHAFEKGMVHRDIKPQNLMLTPKGQVKILDFGLAKLASERGTGKGLTASGAYMGTPDYSAPEQATDARSADIRADLYSLGCTLYCLLAGHPPFQEDTAVKTILAHLEKVPRPLTELRPDVPPALWVVVARLLAKDPAQRFQTPAEVAQALTPFCRRGGKPGPVSPGAATPPGMASPATGTLTRGDPRGTGARAAAPGPRPAVTPPDQTTATPTEGGAWAGLGVGAGRKAGGRRLSVPAIVFGCVGLLVVGGVLVALGVGGFVALTATRAGGVRPPLLDCTGAAGVSPAEVKRSQEAWAKYLGRRVEEEDELAPGVRMKFVLVPAGSFFMGSPAGEQDRFPDEVQHEVVIDRPFYLGKYEVAQAQYEAVLGPDRNPSYLKGADLPVESVSWTEATEYADALTKKRRDGLVYRLPTEAEWEYACRGGRPPSQPFGTSNGTSLSSDQANFVGDLPYGGAVKGKSVGRSTPVGSYPANALGLHDMHGNVWEWCADWYGPYPAGKATDPAGPADGSSRVNRGGGWSSSARFCRAAGRSMNVPGYRNDGLGFRLARSVPSGK
jgi:formylglycine-generating enzyme required for sulfatase activity/tRNA A-37 threonylcarbamoyl transferase component Bud32